jgi:hypothetical protein
MQQGSPLLIDARVVRPSSATRPVVELATERKHLTDTIEMVAHLPEGDRRSFGVGVGCIDPVDLLASLFAAV